LIFCTQVEFYPHHGYLNISLTVWLGIYLFFIIERCLKIFMDSKARRRGETVGGKHSHHALPAKELENLLSTSVGTVLLESSVHPSTEYIYTSVVDPENISFRSGSADP
jgi:hypothetical protein